MADATVTTTKQLNLDELTRLLGAPVTLVSGSALSTSNKTISAPVPQSVLTNAIAEYTYLPGVYSPQNAEEELASFVSRVPEILTGTDAFSGTTTAIPALTSAQVATPNATDLATAETLANALKVAYNALQADLAALRAALLTRSSSDIQTILAWLLIAEHGAEID